MPESVAPPTAPAGSFQQNPDDLFKKRAPVIAEPTPDPVKDAAEIVVHEASLKELKEKLPSLLFGDKPKPPAPDAAKVAADAAAAKALVDAKAAADAAAGTPAAVTPEPKKLKVTKQPDALEVARVTGQEMGRVIAESQRQAPAAPVIADAVKATDGPPAHFSEDDKENYELFKTLSEADPGKYKDSHVKFASFVDKAAAHKRTWEKSNPGKTYDSADHDDFYSQHQPYFTPEDMSKARTKLEVSREVETRLTKQREEYETKMRDLENRTVGPEVARQAQAAAGHATSQFIEQLGDASIKAALVKGVDELKSSDPLAFDVVNHAAATLQQEVVELHSIVNRSNYFNPSNPTHKGIADFVQHQEANIKRLPAQQQLFEGKQFATRSEFSALTQQQRAGYWTLTEPDVVHMLTQVAVARATKTLEVERSRMAERATKYGYTKTAASQTPPPAPAAGTTPAPVKAAKPSAPSADAGAAGAPLAAPGKGEEKSTEKKLVASLF